MYLGFTDVFPSVPVHCLLGWNFLLASEREVPPGGSYNTLCVVVINTVHEIKILHISRSIFAHDYLKCKLLHLKKKKKRINFNEQCRSALLALVVKALASSTLWYGSFPWLGNLYMPRAQPKIIIIKV